MSKLFGKIAVVTGGTGGLGRSVVTRLLEEKATVIAAHTGNSKSKFFLKETKQRYPEFFHDSVDVTSEKDIQTFIHKTTEQHRRIDILCNLAGGVSKKDFIEDISIDEWNRMISLNLNSCFFMMKYCLPIMKKNGWGRIINIAAMTALKPDAKRGSYAVSKSGVVTLTQVAAEEVKEFNAVTVNAIAPSIIATEENKSWGTEIDHKKWVTPEDIAEMIIHLCSDAGAAIHGQIIQMYGKV